MEDRAKGSRHTECAFGFLFEFWSAARRRFCSCFVLAWLLVPSALTPTQNPDTHLYRFRRAPTTWSRHTECAYYLVTAHGVCLLLFRFIRRAILDSWIVSK